VSGEISTPTGEGNRSDRMVILSPHSDDACFSLGYLAMKSPDVCVVTVFSRSGYLPGLHGKDQITTAEAVTEVRQKEDLRFAERAKVNLISLGLLDAPLRGITSPLHRQPESRDLEYVDAPLNHCLKIFRSQSDRLPMLFAPLGIGMHIDHLTLRDWTLNHFASLSGDYRIGFYEDLHYASDKHARNLGIRDFKQRLNPGLSCRRLELPLGKEVSFKLELLESYASQFLNGKPSISAFTPAAGDKVEPHEAVWLVDRIVHGDPA
jgi:hypothetical protein